MASPLTLLIAYSHGVLLRDIAADSLFNDICSKHLLDINDQTIICAGHSVHHRNLLLLEYVRHMGTKEFLAFCVIVQNVWPEVGTQLITGMYICTVHTPVHTYVCTYTRINKNYKFKI